MKQDFDFMCFECFAKALAEGKVTLCPTCKSLFLVRLGRLAAEKNEKYKKRCLMSDAEETDGGDSK